MDKYLTRPRNPQASAKQNALDTTNQDCGNHENFDYQKDIQCAIGKDIRSFFAKYDAKNESLKTEMTSAWDIKQLFKKSEEVDVDHIKEKNDKKRQFPDSSDEEEANKSILKIKINWPKRQKLQPEVKNIEQLPPTRLVAEQHDTPGADAETNPSDEGQVQDPEPTNPSDEGQVQDPEPTNPSDEGRVQDPEPTNREVSTSNEVTEVHKVQSEVKQTEVNKNDEEGQGANVEAGNNSLRRSSRRCSVPSRLGSMVMLDNEVKSPRGKKESQLKTTKKPLKVSDQQPRVDDDDDVIIVGVANNNNGKVAELAPMFRKHPKMSAEEKERKKNFLMSGVPEEIRRQQVALQNQTSSAYQYTPFPRFNHVTQMSVDDDDESSNSPIPLPYVNVDRKIQTPVFFFPQNLFGHLWSESETEKQQLRENLVSVSPAFGRSSDVLEHLLREIKTSNLEFPVKSIYQMLTSKQEYRTKKYISLPKNSTEVIISDDDDDDDDDDNDGDEVYDKEEQLEDDRSANENIMSKFQTEERNLLWTEKYAPARANEIIGNKAECKKVYDWLLELKAKYSHSSDDKGSDSMDDFWTPGGVNDGGSNPSSFSSNALLIVGPHGIGKTALVYAVARELGFKVFEVNPSSVREGKQVWSQLQEATQSHQLHTSRCHSSTNEEARKEEILKTKTEEKPKSKSPRGKVIPSLFGSKVHLKTSNNANKKQKIIMETTKKNKASMKKSKLGRKKYQKKGVKSGYSSAAKTSLILFDEADVVFESDRGFWSAVQKFVKTTKRPIVLTVSDENFVQKFGMEIEVVNMKRPDNALVSSYLRTMALAEGLRLDELNVGALVESFNCDIRRCILQFQMMFSHKIPRYLSSLRPICCSKSSLEPSPNETKDWQGNAERQSNAVNGCTVLPGELRTSKGEDSNPGNVRSRKLALHQSSMTSYFNSSTAPCADDDDDDFVLSPATKRSRKMNRIESEDDLEQHCSKTKEDHDNDDGRAMEGEKKDEFVTFDCEIPVFRMPRVFWESSDVGPSKPPFYKNLFATTFQNICDDFSSNVLRKSSDCSESHNETDEGENMQSLKLLSKLFDQVSLNEVTFRNHLEPWTSEASYDLQFRKLSKLLPGESDQFGFDEEREAKLSFGRLEEEIRNAIFDATSRQFSEQIFKNGSDSGQPIAKQDKEFMECQRRLTGVFQDRQSLMSDLRKGSIKNHTRWNPMPEILPMLIKMSEAENQRKVNKSKRRFLHHLSYIYPNIHTDRFNMRM